MSFKKEVVGGVNSELLSLHMKGMLAGSRLAFPRNQLPLGKAVSPGSARPQDVKASNAETRKYDVTNIVNQYVMQEFHRRSLFRTNGNMLLVSD